MDKKPIKPEALIQKIILTGFVVGIIGLIIFACTSILFLGPVDTENDNFIEFTVKEGWTKNTIADKLEEVGLIQSAFFFKFYMKANNKEMYAGTYNLSKSMSVDEIIQILNSMNSIENETITVTFIEGKRLITYAKKISENFPFTEEEILTKLSDEDYLRSLIDQYWFITDAILNKDIYYPLEGYLFPDTYNFKKSATLEEIIDKMLNTMESKLSLYQEEITTSPYTIHELITFASIVETEGPNKYHDNIAGVFNNRLKNWESQDIGSCVTTYYAMGKEMGEGLTMSDLNTCNPYNTRGNCAVRGLPVGPIASPGLSAIGATMNPPESEFYFFVSDKNMDMYFTKTNVEHESKIRELQRAGLWAEL